MKYIKEYNKFHDQNNSDLENLSDYLLEIFDKFGIVNFDFIKKPSSDQIWYWLDEFSQRIDIGNIGNISNGGNEYESSTRETWYKIHDEIMRILPTIEKRLGKEIEIRGSHANRDWMQIKIV